MALLALSEAKKALPIMAKIGNQVGDGCVSLLALFSTMKDKAPRSPSPLPGEDGLA